MKIRPDTLSNFKISKHAISANKIIKIKTSFRGRMAQLLNVSENKVGEILQPSKMFTCRLNRLRKIVEIFHGADAANSALEHFKNTFSNKVFPENAPEFTTDKSELSVMEILQIGMPTESKGELRRLVLQNAVTINDAKVVDINQVLATDEMLFVRVGRKTFFKTVKK